MTLKVVESMRKWIKIAGLTPMGEKVGLGLADDIQAEVDKYYMQLPLDADGVPIRVGDKVELIANGMVETVTGYETFGLDKDTDETGWILTNETCLLANSKGCRHVKPRTVEDVLDDFARAQGYLYVNHQYKGITDYNELRALYAAELRMAVSGNETES